MKIAALRRLLPAEIKVHMNMMIKDATTYSEVKAAVTEYEVAERRYQPLRDVYEQTATPMEVDQVWQVKGGAKKGKKGNGKSKGDKPTCKTCGRQHHGVCWGKKPDKGAGGGKGKSSTDSKGPCQICGKENHTADKCWQRYKEKDPQKGSGKTGKVHQVKEPETGGTVTAVRAQEPQNRAAGHIDWGAGLHGGWSSPGADRLPEDFAP